MLQEVFSMIAGSPAPVPMQENWAAALEGFLDSGDDDQVEGALAALGNLETEHFDARLKALADDADGTPLVRIKALAAVSDRSKAISANISTSHSCLVPSSSRTSSTNDPCGFIHFIDRTVPSNVTASAEKFSATE